MLLLGHIISVLGPIEGNVQIDSEIAEFTKEFVIDLHQGGSRDDAAIQFDFCSLLEEILQLRCLRPQHTDPVRKLVTQFVVATFLVQLELPPAVVINRLEEPPLASTPPLRTFWPP